MIYCITIIGIPFGIQYFKLAGISLWPVGQRVISTDLVPPFPAGQQTSRRQQHDNPAGRRTKHGRRTATSSRENNSRLRQHETARYLARVCHDSILVLALDGQTSSKKLYAATRK